MSDDADRDPFVQPEFYRLSVGLGVVEHLGIRLYSDIPTALAEAVANAWDADSPSVSIDVDPANRTVTITDTGVGMSPIQLQDYYLEVGEDRRTRELEADSPDGAKSPSGRPVMGRKGIGKLAMFGVGETITIMSARMVDGKLAKSGCVLPRRDLIEASKKKVPMEPAAVPTNDIPLEVSGTRIVVSDVDGNLDGRMVRALRTRLARKFSVIGEDENFEVVVDNDPVTADDRPAVGNVEYVWRVGDSLPPHISAALSHVRADRTTEISATTPDGHVISGWIGTVPKPRDRQGEGGISVFARGRVIDGDLTRHAPHSGAFASYVVGELIAEHLDVDEQEDIAITNRESAREADPRVEDLVKYLKETIYPSLDAKWSEWRKEDGSARAEESQAIKDWVQTLDADRRPLARKLLSAVANAELEDDDQRHLYASAVVAFETLKVQDELHKLADASDDQLVAMLDVAFNGIEALEAAYLSQAARARLLVIQELEDKVDENVLEKVLQDHLFQNLWLIEPDWRGTQVESRKEKAIKSLCDKELMTLDEAVQNSRVDLEVRTAAGKYVIIELKRYLAAPTPTQLFEQVTKYSAALKQEIPKLYPNDPFEFELVLVVGPKVKLSSDVINSLRAVGARVTTYDELISNARAAHADLTAALDARSLIKPVLDAIVVPPATPELVSV